MFDFKKTSPIANELANKALKEILRNVNQLRNYCEFKRILFHRAMEKRFESGSDFQKQCGMV